MARPRNQVPSLFHHRPTRQARVRIGGRDIYLGRWGSKQARTAYARILAELEAVGESAVEAARIATTAGSEGISVAELCDRWVVHAERTYRKNGKVTSTVATFKTPIRVTRELYALTPVAQFGPLKLEAVRNELVKLDLSRGVVNGYVGAIRSIIRWGVSRQLVPVAVLQSLETLAPLRAGRTAAKETEAIKPVDDATIAATIAKLPGVVADMVRLCRVTGMRPGEVCQLRPIDVDRSEGVWRYSPPSHKTLHKDKSRTVWIGPKGQDILLPYLDRNATAHCFDPREAVAQMRLARAAARKTPLGYGNGPGTNRKRKPARCAGDCYTNDTFRRSITRACELAFGMPDELQKIPKGLPDAERQRLLREAGQWRAEHTWHPNQLRHTFATEARAIAGLEAAQALLGHARLTAA